MPILIYIENVIFIEKTIDPLHKDDIHDIHINIYNNNNKSKWLIYIDIIV